MAEARKHTKKHLKTSTIGVTTSVQFGDEWVEIRIRIPRRRLTQRLVGRNLHHLKRLGIYLDSINR